MNISQILANAEKKMVLNKDELIKLLEINVFSDEFYKLISLTNHISRTEFNNKAYIFAQIGINSSPCSGNCKFCSLASDFFSVKIKSEKTIDEIVKESIKIAKENINDLFLMTTADYNFKKFIQIGMAVRKSIPANINLVANIGDFNISQAKLLKTAGFSGAYHIHRLREGVDTSISPEQRFATINAIKQAGLELYYCVEPIGPEHGYDEIADEIIRARENRVNVMAVMRRISVEGTPLAASGMISSLELVKIAAVTMLGVQPKKSMNVHEPLEMALLAGINQFYAEIGVNPRDIEANTELHRGFSINRISNMFKEAGYKL